MTVKIYKINPAKVAAIRQVLAADHWARKGYTLRSGKGMGFDIAEYFLYVDAPDKFFDQYEGEVLIDGVVAIKGNEYDNVKKAFDAEEDNVASGIALFG